MSASQKQIRTQSSLEQLEGKTIKKIIINNPTKYGVIYDDQGKALSKFVILTDKSRGKQGS